MDILCFETKAVEYVIAQPLHLTCVAIRFTRPTDRFSHTHRRTEYPIPRICTMQVQFNPESCVPSRHARVSIDHVYKTPITPCIRPYMYL